MPPSLLFHPDSPSHHPSSSSSSSSSPAMASETGRTATADACDDAERALKLFLQGKFDEAEAFIEGKSRTKDEVPGVVLIFIHCHAVILFAKAGISGTEEDRKQAMERLQEAAALAGEHIPKQGWVQSIASWGMSYIMAPQPKPSSISEGELSCRIIEAEATYLSALLCFFEESISAFFKAALLIRRAIRGYKHCHEILQTQGNCIGSEHEIGAVKLGFGGFNLAISMLPPKLSHLLSVLGFPCDRKAGLHAIEESLQGGGLRASVAGMFLLSYHVVLPAFFSIPQEREHHVQASERVLCILQRMYPDSFFLSFYRGRLQRLKQDLVGSTNYFMSLDKGVKLHPDSKFFKLRHAWVYELGLSYMLQLQWEDAQRYWAELEEESVWSRAFFAYMHGTCLSMRGMTSDAAEKFAKVEGLMRGKMSGKVLAEEQYVSRKVKDYCLDCEDSVKSLQGRISGVEFLYLWNSFPQMPRDKLEGVIWLVENAQSSSECKRCGVDQEEDDALDDFAICNLIKGSAFRELGRLDDAQACLEELREELCFIETEVFIYPMAAYERALVLITQYTELNKMQGANLDLLSQAKKELAIAESFKRDYNFLWRLLGRVHAAHGAIETLMMGEEKTTSICTSVLEDY